MQSRRQPKITPELLFAFYEEEFKSALSQLKEKYPKPHLLPAVLEIIHARRNQRRVVNRVRQGVRQGIYSYFRLPIDAVEGPQRGATEKAPKTPMTSSERNRERKLFAVITIARTSAPCPAAPLAPSPAPRSRCELRASPAAPFAI